MKRILLLLVLIISIFSCSKEDDNGEGEGNGAPEGKKTYISFSFKGVDYRSDSCSEYNHYSCPSMSSVNSIITLGEDRLQISLINMPIESFGTFQMTDENFECTPFLIFIDYRSSLISYRSESGTITKTGDKTFDFSAIVYSYPENIRYLMTGSGAY